MNESERLHVIVRAAGERTAACCCAELVRQTSVASVERVETAPFWRTLREGLQRGLASEAAWVFSIDADVIPAPDAVERARACIRRAQPQTGVLTCMIQDKFLGGTRFGGVRIYRTAAIPDMLDVMPPQGSEVRPETATINRSAERGWREQQIPELLGIHDYEQYYRDIYRKAFLHMQKHGYMAARFLPAWKEKAAQDADYRAALGGAGDALFETADADCDVTHSAYKPEAALKRMGLLEKDPLSQYPLLYEREVRNWQESLDAGRAVPISAPEQQAFDRATPDDDAVRRLERIGESLKLFANISPRTRAAALHQARRALPDRELLDTFSMGELIRYVVGRVRRANKR